jgi:hypothetical protein
MGTSASTVPLISKVTFSLSGGGIGGGVARTVVVAEVADTLRPVVARVVAPTIRRWVADLAGAVAEAASGGVGATIPESESGVCCASNAPKASNAANIAQMRKVFIEKKIKGIFIAAA